MPQTQDATGVAPEIDNGRLDRRRRRAVWAAWFLTMLVAAMFYWGKAAEDRSAFMRWRHQVREFWDGKNIWDEYLFPNPPIMPLSLSPLMALPPLAGAMLFFALKVGLTAAAVRLCVRMAEGSGRTMPWWGEGLILLLSLRPILSDLQHGNINILILFFIVATLEAWRRQYDVMAGLLLALAISYKVTPALFLPYFLYKRSWRVSGATMLGLGIFLLIVPSAIMGVQFNAECLAMWWHRIISPYVASSRPPLAPEINQSMVGVLMRLFTEGRNHAVYGNVTDSNFLSLNPRLVILWIKVLSLFMVGLLALFCRTKDARRNDARLLGEFSLVVLTMLFVSERSWKHHYVTLLLPFTYLVYRVCVAPRFTKLRLSLLGSFLLSMILMATTSSEVGGLFLDGNGHKIAQGYGMFLWAGVVLYIATAWRVVRERSGKIGPDGRPVPKPVLALPATAPAPHLPASTLKAPTT